MPECTSPLREELKAYVDGELSTGERVRVEQHLKRCGTCQAELQSLQQLTQTLTTAFPELAPLSVALRARILSQLPEPAPVRPLPFWRRRGPQALGGGVLAFACAVWLWGRVPQETLQEKTFAAATASAPAASVVAPVPEAAAVKGAEDRAKAPSVAPTPETALANRAMARREVFASKGAPRLASPAAPSVPLTTHPKQEVAPPPSESRLTFGTPSKPMAPPLAPAGGPTAGGGIPGGGIAGGGRGGFGGGSPSFKAKAVLSVTQELTLTVAVGKADATMAELKKRIEELGGSATVTEKPKKLTVTLPSEKALVLRSQLEALGKVTPPPGDVKQEQAVESFGITVQEESGN